MRTLGSGSAFLEASNGMKENGGIKTTPAMAVGLTNRPWRVEDILERMDPTRALA